MNVPVLVSTFSMQSFESFFESKFLDRVSEKPTGPLSRLSTHEFNELQNRFEYEKAQKDSISLTTNLLSMSFANPIGFLVSLFLFGRLDKMDKSPEELRKEEREKAIDFSQLAAAEALNRKKIKAKLEFDGDRLIAVKDEETDLKALKRRRKTRIKSESRLVPKKQENFQTFGSQYFLTREAYVKLNRLRRAKLMLEAVIEHQRKNQDFKGVSQSVAERSLIDKALVKLGA